MTLHFPCGRAIYDLKTLSISAPWVLSGGLEAALRRVCVSGANAWSETAQRLAISEVVAEASVRFGRPFDHESVVGQLTA